MDDLPEAFTPSAADGATGDAMMQEYSRIRGNASEIHGGEFVQPHALQVDRGGAPLHHPRVLLDCGRQDHDGSIAAHQPAHLRVALVNVAPTAIGRNVAPREHHHQPTRASR